MSAFAEADFMNDAGDGRGHGDGEGALRPLYLQVVVGGCGAAQPGRGAAEGAPPAGKAGWLPVSLPSFGQSLRTFLCAPQHTAFRSRGAVDAKPRRGAEPGSRALLSAERAGPGRSRCGARGAGAGAAAMFPFL